MATGQSLIRQIQRLCGDPNGRMVSKELIVDLINEEAPRVLATFKSTVRIETANEETEPAYAVLSADLALNRLTIMRVYVNRYEAREMRTIDMERITQT